MALSIVWGVLYVLTYLVIFLFLLIAFVCFFASYHFPSEGLFGRLNNGLNFLRIALSLIVGSQDAFDSVVTSLYIMWKHHIYADNTFINLGYWKDAETLDQAGENLARIVAETGGMNENDVVLDCGFGYGDQDIFFHETYNPKKIVGINITEGQISSAQERMAELGIDDTVQLKYGNATDLKNTFEKESFDLVVAVESAFHFYTREEFFEHAAQVLAPGGRIAMADLIPLINFEDRTWYDKIFELVRLSLWCFPMENIYLEEEYVAKMKKAGFTEVKILDISEHVFEPLRSFGRKRLSNPEFLKTFNFVHRNRIVQEIAFAFYSHGFPFPPMKYVIVYGKK